MKFSFPTFRFFALFVLLLCACNAYTQQLSDEVSSKLSESDQKKLTKAENIAIKGDLQLSKANYPGDKQLMEMLSMGETKELKKYAGERITTSGNYKDANSGKFQIYEENCNGFWKKYTGEKNPLEIVKQAQLKSINLFNSAKEIRKNSEKKSKISEKLPLLFEAEAKEKEAVSLLQKVLFVYLNYPVNYDQTWFSAVEAKTEIPDTTASVQPVIQTPILKTTSDTTSTKINVPIQQNKAALKEKDSDNVPGDSSLYMLANVREDQVDQFNSFLQKNYPDKYENYIIDFQNIDYSNLEALRDMWHQYRFGSPTTDSITMLADNKPIVDSYASDTIKQIIAQDIIKTDTLKTTIALQTNTKTQKQKTKAKTIIRSTLSVKEPLTQTQVFAKTEITEPIAKGFLFRVQVAASRVPLNEIVLKNIYTGSEKISETNEDNWYKYTIGEFNTYKQARQLRDDTNVQGVFVVAYINGKRFKITPSVVSKKQTSEYQNTEGILPEKIEFRVQLVASKIALDAALLKNIYNGSLAIDIIDEDGWLKYSLLAGNKLSDALELYKSINVPGSFVVAYYNHQKLNLHTAIKLTKKN